MPIYAERKFSFNECNEVLLQIMKPVRYQKRWTCSYKISFDKKVIESYAAGYDSLDSLLCAITKIKIYFINSDQFRESNIFWLDEGDLGLDLSL